MNFCFKCVNIVLLDEDYCYRYQCHEKIRKSKCDYKCIPVEWFCDGIRDCNDGKDEADCGEI